MSVNARERVKPLVELVPDEDLPTLARMLAGVAVELECVSLEAAPEDDEPVTQEDDVLTGSSHRSHRLSPPAHQPQATQPLG